MIRFLVAELDIDESVARRLPDDREVPPRPDGFAPPPAPRRE
jgi:hypothetical protein